MYKNKKILGLIPARGGSKGLPGKNIIKTNGKPLIYWTIAIAQKSKYLDKIEISTDNQKIADIAKTFGLEVPFLRPEELASDTATSADATIHAIDFFKNRGEDFDYICLLEPTSPLRKVDDIDNAIKLLIDNEEEYDSLSSIGEIHMEHPEIAKTFDGKNVEPYIAVDEKKTRRQDYKKSYFPYGVVYLIKIDILRKENTFYAKRNMGYTIERWQNYEVDDEYDLICIDAIMKYMKFEV